jgi:UDP-N-acetylmuramate--alanine ligase
MSALGRSETLRAWLQAPGAGAHLAGVCGVGMAGLAVWLRACGVRVTGCDTAPGPLAAWLEARGIPVAAGHDPAHLEGVSALVRSTAVHADTPEVARARTAGLPVFRRGEVLAALLEGPESVAVGGTHGKTTTSAWIAQLLTLAGRDPAWCVGGEPRYAPGAGRPDPGVAGAGTGPRIVEADESDGTAALYRPAIAVLTNLEFDHAEHFTDPAALEACLRQFVANAARAVVWCADDPGSAGLSAAGRHGISYGMDAAADWRINALREQAESVRFAVTHCGEDAGWFTLAVPGRHNVLNALAALAVCRLLGVDLEALRAALPLLALPRRRFERVAERAGVTVVSDYAHHPGELRALLRTARGLGPERLRVLFQPHRYSRTRRLAGEFATVLQGMDELILLPVYPAFETPEPGGDVEDLYARMRAAGTRPVPKLAASLRQAWEYVRATARRGDLILLAGAGDIGRIAEWAADAPPAPGVQTAEDGPRDRRLGNRTTLGVGGAADNCIAVESVAELSALLRRAHAGETPLHVLGAGSNLLVSDLGVRGWVVRLRGGPFDALREAGGTVVAGAAVSLARLLAFCDAVERTGLEFLDGIPGCVGGALRMNAGAWGGSLCECVKWIRCLNADGTAVTVHREELDAGYRRCGALAGRVAVAAAFTLARGDRAASRALRRTYTRERAWMRGIRSAGSVFRNPPGAAAGRLLEDAGMKGAAVGGAAVSARHANVIVTRPGATASDVRALMALARRRVAARCGVRLEPEIVEWE